MDLPINQDDPIRPVDQLVLDILRREEGLSIQELMERLEVTATAIRQRIDRLEASGYIEKRKHSVGRGRPSFTYFLTDRGWRQAGVTYRELAISLWSVISQIEDPGFKSEIVNRVAQRMGEADRTQIPESSLHERIRVLANLLTRRKSPASINDSSEIPSLEVHACPFPDLVGNGQDRTVCKLEQEALSKALGQPLQLSKCRLDGHGCCQFVPESIHVQPQRPAQSATPP